MLKTTTSYFLQWRNSKRSGCRYYLAAMAQSERREVVTFRLIPFLRILGNYRCRDQARAETQFHPTYIKALIPNILSESEV